MSWWLQQTTTACVYLCNKTARSVYVPQNLKHNNNLKKQVKECVWPHYPERFLTENKPNAYQCRRYKQISCDIQSRQNYANKYSTRNKMKEPHKNVDTKVRIKRVKLVWICLPSFQYLWNTKNFLKGFIYHYTPIQL